MQNSFGVCELASFKRRLSQKLNPNCNTKCAPTPDEDSRIWTNEQAAQPPSPPTCTERAQATRNLPKPLHASATSWMCLLLNVQRTCCIFRFSCNCQPSAPCDFCSFSVIYLIFFLGNLDLLYTEFCCLPQPLQFFSVIFPFLLLFSAMVTSMPSTSQKSSGWATGGTEKLMQPINFARAGSVPTSNITQWQYQKTANCCVVLHRIGGLAPEDPDKHLGLALLTCLQCRELKSVFGWEETTQPAQHQEKSLEGHASPGTALGPLDSTEEPCKDTSRNMSLVLSPPQLESGEQQQSTSFQPQVYAGWPAPVLYVCV